MKLIDALDGYKNNTRGRLLKGTLDINRIALIYQLDRAAATAEGLLNDWNPFSVEITSDNLDALYEEADGADERFRDQHLKLWGHIDLLFNYCE